MIIVSTLGPNSTDKENEDFKQRMKFYATIYDWKQDGSANKTSSLATKAWDSLQKLSCCGLVGPDDWDSVRPQELPNNLYPISCCLFTPSVEPHHNLCQPSRRLFRTGCLNQIRWLEDMNLLVHSLFVALQLTLTILSALFSFSMKYCSRQDYSEQRNSVTSFNNSQFGSNVSFPPQPAYNEAYVADERCWLIDR